MNIDLEQLKYPIGRYQALPDANEEQTNKWMGEIAELPQKLRAAVAGLNDEQLDTAYRPDGWTLRQVVHHLADSHLNAYFRFKLALTEENPSIRPYDENLWAGCDEAKHGAIGVSLDLLENLHQRWMMALKTLKPADFERTYFHPQHQKTFNIKYLLGLYAWHGAHHVAHITETKKRHKWL
ncbi:MAG: YfiT family bacillithiol transferase [Sphingobacteriaceae bacterium]